MKFLIFLTCFIAILFSSYAEKPSSDLPLINENEVEEICYNIEHFSTNAIVNDFSLYEESEKDYISFWEKQAGEITWFEKWDTTLDWNPPFAKWFKSGKLNVSYNCLDRHVLSGNGNKAALIWCNEKEEKRTLTYAELFHEVNRLANVLKSFGIKKGDRVAIYMPMIPEGVASMLACSRIGAIHSVIFGGIGKNSVKGRLLDAEAKLIITADGSYRRGKVIPYKSQLDEILESCPSVEKVLVYKHVGNQLNLKKERDFWYQEEMARAEPYCEPEIMDAEDPLFILYTSGTTGNPKGILHTTGGYLVGVHSTFKWVFDIKQDDVYWSTADIGWITGHSFVVYGPLSNGVSQVIYEGSFDYPTKTQIPKIIDENKVSIFYTAPTLIRMMMKWGDECLSGGGLETLRLLGSIGEPINPETWLWYYKNIGKSNCPIVDTWFQTETGALVISPLPGITPLRPGTITKALPGYNVAILDESGKESDRGFLAILNPYPSMMRGIYKDQERYISTYWSKWEGKYYFAGDAAHKDGEGNIWIDGRADEVLKIAGHRIGTAEIENCIIQNQMVAESAVCGVNDELKGSAIIAFVVLKDNQKPLQDFEFLLKKEIRDSLGAYCTPEKVVLVDALPKTRSGKIMRRILKDLVEGRELGNITTLVNPSCLEALIRICGKLHEEVYGQQKRDSLLNQISALPCFGEINHEPYVASSLEISNEITPLIRKHLKSTNYDRIHLVEQFVDFCIKIKENSNEFDKFEVIKAMADFEPNMSVEIYNGSSCCGLTMLLFDQIPEKFNAYVIPAQLNTKFKQKGWSKYSHTAILISYASPIDKSDRGYILLDPNFDIDEPIILLEDGTPFYVDLKDKGKAALFLEKNKIIFSFVDHPEFGDLVYEIKNYYNPFEVGVKPMIADGRISCVSRDEHGVHLGHLNIVLDKAYISWSINYKKMPPIPFQDFVDGGHRFTENFASLFNLTAKSLNETILKIISNLDIILDFTSIYYDLVEDSSRPDDFFSSVRASSYLFNKILFSDRMCCATQFQRVA